MEDYKHDITFGLEPKLQTYVEELELSDYELTLDCIPIWSSNYSSIKYLKSIINQVSISLDKIEIHVMGSSERRENFLQAAKKIYRGKVRRTKRKSGHKYLWEMRCDGDADELRIFYKPVPVTPPNKYPAPIKILFCCPTISFLKSLNTLILSHDLKYTVSNVEIPVDFFTYHHKELYYLLTNCGFLKYGRFAFWSDEERQIYWKARSGCIYYLDPRHSPKSAKFYMKETSKKNIKKVRVELTLYRDRLREFKIHHFDELMAFNLGQLLSQLVFYDFRWNKFEASTFSQHREEINTNSRIRYIIARKLEIMKEWHLNNGLQSMVTLYRRKGKCAPDLRDKDRVTHHCDHYNCGHIEQKTGKSRRKFRPCAYIKKRNKSWHPAFDHRYFIPNHLTSIVRAKIRGKKVVDILRP